jgi:hypothetical protein
VTGELERRWNETLARVSVLEERLRELEQAPSSHVAIDAAELFTLGADFARVWQDPSTDMRLKKRIEIALTLNRLGIRTERDLT